jgi:hypothetical protein
MMFLVAIHFREGQLDLSLVRFLCSVSESKEFAEARAVTAGYQALSGQSQHMFMLSGLVKYYSNFWIHLITFDGCWDVCNS